MGKYKTNYNEDWKLVFPCFKKCKGKYSLFCGFCKKNVCFENGGKGDLERHANEMHRKFEKEAAGRNMANFFKSSCKYLLKNFRCETSFQNYRNLIFFLEMLVSF